jgi:hypothetical protein
VFHDWSPLVRIDACGVVWINDEGYFHHAITTAAVRKTRSASTIAPPHGL